MASDYELRPHKDWIGLLQPVGLVVSPPALLAAQAFPDKNILKEQQALLALVTPPTAKDADKAPVRRTPTGALLPLSFQAFATKVLGWKVNKLAGSPEGPALPDSLDVVLPDLGETLRPTYAVPGLKEDDAAWMMLVQELADGTPLDEPAAEGTRTWQASPEVRFERLLRETAVPIGVLCNGRLLRLVYAPRGESSGHITWPVHRLTTALDRTMLSALCMLLGSPRLFALSKDQRLPHILKESRKYQNVVSTQLAGQVLEALNELLRGFQGANEASKGTLLDALVDDDANHVYGGLLAVLLRLVFILYAEERGLLSSSAVYVRNYSLIGLFDKLRVDAGRFPDTMDQRYGAWSRLLVLFRMVHDGAKRGDFQLPPRHGHLFDPDGWSFLEGRSRAGGRESNARLNVPKVSDGVILRVLEKLLLLDGDRLSYRALDVEQIGSVYENMMGFRLERAIETCIGVGKEHVVVGLQTLLAKRGSEREKHLKEVANVSITGKASETLKQAATVDELVLALQRRISPLTPRTVPVRGLYLQPTDERRRSGSHYTPRELTEPIVRTTLRPILEDLGASPKPEQILALKVCDPAMGSGAFLVEACRQLGEQLVRAYDVHGRPAEVRPDEDVVLYAQRQVAQRCLYGVDKNPFAVDLGKLSLWLATLARDHAFTFLDHAIRHGDSLVGLFREQIASFHWAPEKQVPTIRKVVDDAIAEALELRARIQDLASSDDVAEKQRLLGDADAALEKVRAVGDVVVGCFFSEDKAKAREEARKRWEGKILHWLAGKGGDAEIDGFVHDLRAGERGVPCFHWEIEFPEVFAGRGGFDVMVGNPPFLGGKLISTLISSNYERMLKWLYENSLGAADLVAYFFRRCFGLLRKDGKLGLVATHAISETATRAVSLDTIEELGGQIFDAWDNVQWPGEASVTVSRLSISKGRVVSPVVLNGVGVRRITSSLMSGLNFSAAARLAHGIRYSEGTKLFGDAFVLSSKEAELVQAREPNIAKYLRRFVNGDVLNLTPRSFDGRWVVDFGELTEEEIDGCDIFLEMLKAAITRERANQTKQVHEHRPWLHWDKRTRFYLAARERRRIVACATPSRFLSFVFVDPECLFTHSVKLFDDERASFFCVLQSRIHESWAVAASSSLGTSIRYSTSTSFDTFPFPRTFELESLTHLGERYLAHRQTCLDRREIGPTSLCGSFHDPDETSPDILRLRELHAEMDRAVLDAYGWTDIQPTCEFLLDYEDEEDDDESPRARRKKKPWRYRWPDEIRDEVLARLLELNAVRAREEAEAAALAEKASGGGAKGTRAKGGKKVAKGQGKLFGGEGE